MCLCGCEDKLLGDYEKWKRRKMFDNLTPVAWFIVGVIFGSGLTFLLFQILNGWKGF